jgi:hypothetical protein
MAISIFVELGNREHFIFVRIIGLHKPVLPNTPSIIFYKARAHIKSQTLKSLTNNLAYNFNYYTINLIWLD